MSMFSRRQFLGSMGAMGAAAAYPGAWAASATPSGLSTDEVLRLEAQATGFSNPLRLPGTSGLFGVLPVTDFKEVHVVRSEIEVLPGQRTPVLAYAVESGGKKFLNPALLARQGDQMRVKLINRIDQPTVIHWHGLSVDSRNDGNGLHVVAPGQQMDYAFTVQDRSSMYWYHPHAHGFIPRQAYHGLASLLFVEDEDEATLRKELALALGESEIPLVLQDKEFDAQGRLRYAPSAAQSFGGWVGSRLMVNLTEHPVLKAGRRIVRFRLLNGSNARSYQLAFLQNGKALGFYLAGTDGGLLAQPVHVEQTFLSPGQRLDVLVDFREAEDGRPVTLASLPFNPMHQEGGHDTAAMEYSHHGAAHGTAAPAAMAMEGTGRRELTELVADHFFRNGHGDELVTVVDVERQTNELRQDRRTTRPGLDRALVIVCANCLDLVDQVRINKRALFERTSHFLPLNACDGAERSCCSCACCCGCDNPWWADPTG